MSTAVVAVAGDAAPGGNGVFQSAGLGLPTLNDSGTAAFVAQLVGTAGGSDDNTGIFVGAPGALGQVVRTGQAAPDGNGVIEDVSSFSVIPQIGINAAGQVAFFADVGQTDGTGRSGLFVGTPAAGLTQIARAGDAVPGGAATYDTGSEAFTYPSIDASGAVATRSRTETSDDTLTSYVRVGGTSPAVLAATGGPLAGGGQFGGGATFALNAAGQIAIDASFLDAVGASAGTGVALADGATVSVVARSGGPLPGGAATFGSVFDYVHLNDAGKAGFLANFTDAVGSGTGLFVGDASGVSMVVRSGDANPDGGTFPGFGLIDLNDAGDVAFFAGNSLYVASGGTVRSVAKRDDAVPGGGTLAAVGPLSFELNDAGSVAFLSSLDTLGSGGIFVRDAAGTLSTAVRLGDALLGSTVVQANFANGNFSPAQVVGDQFSGFNNAGQLAYAFTLADGRNGVAVWTPDAATPHADANPHADADPDPDPDPNSHANPNADRGPDRIGRRGGRRHVGQGRRHGHGPVHP